MLISQENILQFIPQRKPFVMIDSLMEASDDAFQSEFKIAPSNIFLEHEKLSESALIENIAQTCAAGFGYLGSQKGGAAGGLGFIGAVTKVENHKKAKLGDTIRTKINVISSFDNIHLVEGTAYCNEETLLTCQMKIVVT